jgi:hypothetical protein
MSIYGLTIDCFSELKRQVKYFNQLPSFDSGYNNATTPQTIWITYQNVQTRVLKDSNGNLVGTEGQKIRCDRQLNIGWFISDGSIIYRIVMQSGYAFEGNLYTYDIEQVIGDDGSLTNDVIMNTGASNFT